MNELITSKTVTSSGISLSWLLITAAGIFLFSLLEAWIATLIIYGKVSFLKKLFPVTRNLIRSHVDYLIFTMLLCVTYFVCLHLRIELPNAIIVIICFGSIYNPFGFFVQAMNPNAGKSDSLLGKIITCSSFLPTTIGFGYAMIAVIITLT